MGHPHDITKERVVNSDVLLSISIQIILTSLSFTLVLKKSLYIYIAIYGTTFYPLSYNDNGYLVNYQKISKKIDNLTKYNLIIINLIYK